MKNRMTVGSYQINIFQLMLIYKFPDFLPKIKAIIGIQFQQIFRRKVN